MGTDHVRDFHEPPEPISDVDVVRGRTAWSVSAAFFSPQTVIQFRLLSRQVALPSPPMSPWWLRGLEQDPHFQLLEVREDEVAQAPAKDLRLDVAASSWRGRPGRASDQIGDAGRIGFLDSGTGAAARPRVSFTCRRPSRRPGPAVWISVGGGW